MIRYAKPEDAVEIVRLIKELATFEKEPKAATATAQQIESQMRLKTPPFECLIAEEGGKVVGFALYYQTYSTWQATPGMHLEDIFVMAE